MKTINYKEIEDYESEVNVLIREADKIKLLVPTNTDERYIKILIERITKASDLINKCCNRIEEDRPDIFLDLSEINKILRKGNSYE